MYIRESSVITTTKNLIFIDNIADRGYPIHIDNYPYLGEEKREIFLSGYFINNTGYAAVFANTAQITFTDISMTSNSGHAISLLESNVTLNGTTTITKHQESAITAEKSEIIIQGKSIFSKNRGPKGGAINCLDSTIFLSGHTQFTQNTADTDGGALYAVATSICKITWSSYPIELAEVVAQCI